MCQLLGMNCNVPTDICFSFAGFKNRGGLTDIHQDGWGIAFFEGKGVRQFLDPFPSAQSPIAEFVKNYPIQSLNVIAHIRKATQGSVKLENTHPFVREMNGQYWVFAHNGDLPGFSPNLTGSFLPVGTTDSEAIFCWILQELKSAHISSASPAETIGHILKNLIDQICPLGELNFLLSNGSAMFAYCGVYRPHLHPNRHTHPTNWLYYVCRQAPFPTASLSDCDWTMDFKEVTSPTDRVAIIATAPLTTNETWQPIGPRTLLIFQEGTLLNT